MGTLILGIATLTVMLTLMSWMLGAESDAERRRVEKEG
jgi:hypothetical protein